MKAVSPIATMGRITGGPWDEHLCTGCSLVVDPGFDVINKPDIFMLQRIAFPRLAFPELSR